MIRLRDLEGWTSVDTCNALEVSETNQRVLLHRARSKVRQALEMHFEGRVMRIFRIFRRRPGPDLACIELVELVTDYVEGVLSDADRRRVEEHLAACDGCEEYMEQMLTTITLTGRLTVTDVETMRPAARESLMSAFREAYSP